MAKKNPEQRARTKAAITQAFWGLYSQLPPSQMKVRAITDAAGCNRSTFYEYFESIYDLLDQAEEELIEQLRAYLEEVASSVGGAEAVERAAALYREHGAQLDALLGPHGDPSFAIRLKERVKPLVMERFALDSRVPGSDILAECLLGAMTSSVAYWHRGGMPIGADELARVLQAVMVHGAASAAQVACRPAEEQGKRTTSEQAGIPIP